MYYYADVKWCFCLRQNLLVLVNGVELCFVKECVILMLPSTVKGVERMVAKTKSVNQETT